MTYAAEGRTRPAGGDACVPTSEPFQRLQEPFDIE